MPRENRNQAVAALHRENILAAAERMFSQKGFAQATITDICEASAYSRRTIYAYYESKEDILHHIIAKGLRTLKEDIEHALQENADFLDRYFAICRAIQKHQTECPHAAENVAKGKTEGLGQGELSPAVSEILALGNEINDLLAGFVARGQEQGVVRRKVQPMPTVYVLWASITSLLTLLDTKGPYIAKAFSTTTEDFLRYGLTQIINSILKERI